MEMSIQKPSNSNPSVSGAVIHPSQQGANPREVRSSSPSPPRSGVESPKMIHLYSLYEQKSKKWSFTCIACGRKIKQNAGKTAQLLAHQVTFHQHKLSDFTEFDLHYAGYSHGEIKEIKERNL